MTVLPAVIALYRTDGFIRAGRNNMAWFLAVPACLFLLLAVLGDVSGATTLVALDC